MKPVTVSPDLPVCRSQIWSLTKNETWRDSLPALFYPPDVRSTSGPEACPQVHKELELHTPRTKSPSTEPPAHFPLASLLTAAELGVKSSSQAKTKLPRVACQLHAADTGIKDVRRPVKRMPTLYAVTEIVERCRSPSIWTATEAQLVQKSAAGAELTESIAEGVETRSQDPQVPYDFSSAADVWRMLTALAMSSKNELACNTTDVSARPPLSTSVSQPVVKAETVSTGTQTDDTCGPFFSDEATAANLWNILTSATSANPANDLGDTYLASTIPLPCQTASEIDDLNHLILSRSLIRASPVELQGSEVPYIHPNSLTGYSNTRPQTPYADSLTALPTYYDTGLPISSSAYQDPPAYECEVTGLNGMMMDTKYMAHTSELPSLQVTVVLPPTPPRTPVPSSSFHTARWWAPNTSAVREGHPAFAHSIATLKASSSPPQQYDLTSSVLADLFTEGHAKNCGCGYCDSDALDSALNASASMTDSACCMLYPLGSDIDTEVASTKSDAWEAEDDDYDNLATEDEEFVLETEEQDDEDWLWATASEVHADTAPILVTSEDEAEYDDIENEHFVQYDGWRALFDDAVGRCAAHAEADDWSNEDDEEEEEERWERGWEMEDATGWEWAF